MPESVLRVTHAPGLRPYQAAAVEALRRSYASGHRAPLLQLPTGGGKTNVFSHIAAAAMAKGRRVLVVAHRRELIRQAGEKLELAGVTCGFICPGFEPAPDELVQVGSVQTLARRLDKLPAFDLVVIDEAHHSVAGQYRKLLDAQPSGKLLGVTATPARLDGRGLGISDGGPFDDIVLGPSIAELVAEGYLAPCRCFVPEQKLDLRQIAVRGGDYAVGALAAAVDRPSIIGDAVEQYRRRADHQPAIAFCVSVEHAEHVAEAFRVAGYRARCVHGGTPPAERDVAIAGLATGAVEVLTACDLISEGLDVPVVGAVILLRPTKSLVLFMQQVGRGMRPAPGKQALILLDHVGNILEHGLPDAAREWSLSGTPKAPSRNGKTANPMVWCCDCGAANPPTESECVVCGEPKPGGREIEECPGDLAEITAASLAAARHWSFHEMATAPRSEAELREFARARGYHPFWVRHRLREQARGAAQ